MHMTKAGVVVPKHLQPVIIGDYVPSAIPFQEAVGVRDSKDGLDRSLESLTIGILGYPPADVAV